VHSTTQYEQLIAEKLDQVPVPDMADSIWAGIAAQLDAVVDSPPDTSPDTSPDTTPPDAPLDTPADTPSTFNWKGKVWYGFAGMAIIASIIWWYSQPTKQAAPVSPISTPTEHTLPVIEQPAPDSHKVILKPLQDLPVHKKDTEELPSETIINPVTDTVPARYLPLMTMDSAALPVTHPAKPHPQQDTMVLPPPPKKPKGVRGITSDDYRIAVDKDSTKKTNQ